jgi:hypothetical protein
LNGRLGFERDLLQFLGYTVELVSGRVYDRIKSAYVKKPDTLYVLLAHYSEAEAVERVGRLIKFEELPGGYAYNEAFLRRAVSPLAQVLGGNPENLLKAAEMLGGTLLHYGDASVEIPALPLIPVIYVMWKGSEEFDASLSIFFDASASHYLPTEDLAVLAELTTCRLEKVLEYKKKECGY